jgi:hypothetical protein
MNKIFFFLLIFAGANIYAADKTTNILLNYKSKNGVEIATFAFEELFVNTFEKVRFVSGSDKPSDSTIVISMECLSAYQLEDKGTLYRIFIAAVSGKIEITRKDNSIAFVRNIGIIKDGGSNMQKAEIAALMRMKEELKKLIKDNYKKLEECL